MKIAFLGLGKMGSAMARRLLAAGHEVTVWNRSAKAAEALGGEGARVASSALEAVRDQEAVITMLFNDAAHEQILFGDGVIGAIPRGSVHIAASTISVGLSGNLAEEHARLGQLYVAAPVFGRPNVAADGKLWIVAAGADDAIAKGRPALEAMSRGITVVGPNPVQAHALKLAGNFTISMMIQALSEAAVLGQAYGIDPALMMETLNTALFQSPFYSAYIKLMLHPPEPPGGTIALGQKDLYLFLNAARSKKTQLAVAELMETRFAEAVANGLGETDWAAGLLKASESASH
ncbi:MAG TPA: NAD(P)-dependent oxidoreductase [Acidobacteriaceae bacterium]